MALSDLEQLGGRLRALPPDPPATLGGLPGGLGVAAPLLLAFAGDLRLYWPILVEEPVVISGAKCEVTTPAGAGATARAAIYAADAAWQPTARMGADFGAVSIDSGGVKTWAAPNVVLPPGRYLVCFAASASATYRVPGYGMPGVPNVLPAMGANTSAYTLYAIAAHGVLPAVGVAWTTPGATSVPAWFCPVVLMWTAA